MRKIIKLSGDEIKANGLKYYVTGTVAIEIENNYGADADGNRGIQMSYLDDYDLFITNEDQEQVKSNTEQEAILDYFNENWENYT